MRDNLIYEYSRNDIKINEIKNNNNSVLKKVFKKKITDKDFVIPQMHEYKIVMENNYNVKQLRLIAKHYKMKISGNKNELTKRIYLTLKYNYYSILIQKSVRRKFVYKYIQLHGPGFIDRTLCVNNSDFISLDNLKDIDYVNFFSIKDDGVVYGFNIVSLHNYFKNTDNKEIKPNDMKNPYNGVPFVTKVYHKVKRFIKISRILKTDLNLKSYEEENMTMIVGFDTNVRNLFHFMDTLGNYTNPDWFLSLTRPKLLKFIHELHDIWNYRAELSDQAKRNICSPRGNPFINRNNSMPLVIYSDIATIELVRQNTYYIMENMIRFSINRENSAIGCFYLLGALTLVNQDAAEALPWLYQSMYHV